MLMNLRTAFLWAVVFTGQAMATSAHAPRADMTFFVTSIGKGTGADLGGLEGADAHCLALAKAAGSTLTNWRAYLSSRVVTQALVQGTELARAPGRTPRVWWWPRALTICIRTPSTS